MNIPTATYRLQFSSAFTFADAKRIVDYLGKLGISHIYASPIFKARTGSSHGYDVTDGRVLNPELGGEDAFGPLIQKCRNAGIGWIQDIVPNHMALSAESPFIVDVMENGPSSRYYSFFDIDWEHPYEVLHGRILVPVLGQTFGKCLEKGELKLKFENGGLRVFYYDHWFPLRMESYATVFGRCVGALRELLGDGDHDLYKFLGILYTVKNLSESSLDERYDQIGFVKTMLRELYEANPVIREQCDSVLRECNGDNNASDRWALLEAILAEQHFRLTFWKTATEELNYRRFFTVNDLIAVRVEDDEVFRLTHKALIDLTINGTIQGIRIDHIDGLSDPSTYCARLRTQAPLSYIVVEKILGQDEHLHVTWPVQGTTGYDFLNMVNQLSCDMRGQKTFDKIYRWITGEDRSFDELVVGKKRLIIGRHMAGDIDNLALRLKAIAGRDRRGSDITMYGLRRALVELLTFFPVYRTYVNETEYGDSDQEVLRRALNAARGAQEDYVVDLDYIASFLDIDEADISAEVAALRRRFVMRLQQFTGPLTAKGVEDTAFYSYNRLVSLNEVGGAPERFGIRRKEFHRFCSVRKRDWPHTMNATATHDTKRGEDTRARINVLSELPGEWGSNIRRWYQLNKPARLQRHHSGPMPTANDEYLFYQTLTGCFPQDDFDRDTFTKRIKEYMIKAVREAKETSSWIRPNETYEQALLAFIDKVLGEPESPFLSDFIPFQKKVAWYGILNSLMQTTLKMTAPGIPDFYQGTELWDFSLVDPDNRRPVDFTTRSKMLDEIVLKGENSDYIDEIVRKSRDGRIKQFLIHRLCNVRKRYSDVFTGGEYIPLQVTGARRHSLVAFLRVDSSDAVAVAVPRLMTGVVGVGRMPLGKAVWDDTAVTLPRKYAHMEWSNEFDRAGPVLKGPVLAAENLTARFPVAVLTARVRQ
ncbi:MAG: malto-oligosyltrehalose synthase [Chitinispirillaceae bacterium]|nr:malto-oligosyltrehalose synthase [Chitinispirillaceae bacterium]